MRTALPVLLTAEERRQLRVWREDPATTPRLALRARIVLEASRGRTNSAIAAELDLDPETVALWRRRFAVNRLEGIRRDAPRSGRRTGPHAELFERITRVPPAGVRPDGSRWSTRQMAQSLGVSHMRVHRAWHAQRAGALGEPGRGVPLPAVRPVRRVDIAGVYLSPPGRAIVFAVDTYFEPRLTETTRLDPVAPSLPSDELHTGWDGLLGALDRWRFESAFSGHRPHSAQDLLVVLRTIEAASPVSTELHLMLDGFSTEATHRIERWMQPRPRFHRYRVPDAASWTEAVDRWWHRWAEDERGAPGSRNLGECAESLVHFLGQQNPAQSPFAWTPPAPTPAERITVR